MILIPIAVSCIIFLINYTKKKSIPGAIADTWLEVTFLIWGMTEVLSIFHIWTSWAVMITWLLCGLIISLFAWKQKTFLEAKNVFLLTGDIPGKMKKYKGWMILFGTYFILVLILGMLSGQYNMDSMVYHLPRIMHWIQNKSVGHFAAGFEAQVRYPCLSEYLVGQIYLAGLSDRFANMVQTSAYIGSSIMVYGVARKLGASYKPAFMATAVFLCMPMAVAQAYSTQTDNIAGMFLIVYIYNILDFIFAEKLQMDRDGCKKAFFLASNVMLGYLCKPTICFTMVVFFAWMCIVRIYRRDKVSVLIKYVLLGAFIAIVIITPLFLKNYHTYTAVDKAEAQQASENDDGGVSVIHTDQALTPDLFNTTNAIKDPKNFIVVCLENIGRNSMSICFPQYNEKWVVLITKIGGWLHQDTSTFKIPDNASFFYQDMASNPWVMFLTLLMGAVVLLRVSKTNRTQTLYILCAIFSLVLQCALMGYTHYRTRYLIGVMAVLCPGIAVAIEKLRVKEGIRDIVISCAIAGACVGAANTYSYEVPRIKESVEGEALHQYFIGNLEDEYLYSEMGRIINENNYSKIGIDNMLYMEYPLWKAVDKLDRLECVNISSKYTRQYEDVTYEPDCIVRVVSEEEPIEDGDLMECHGASYQCIWSIHWYQNYFCLYAKIDTSGVAE